MSKPTEGPRPAAVAFVLITVLLDVMALGLVIPVLPKLVEQMAGSTQHAALVLGLFGTVWALMQLVFSPLLGAVSDAVGRRPVLLGSSLGLGLDYILMALAPSLAWLFVGRVLSGITAATFSTAGAYIADVTPASERAGKFGLIGAAFGAGFVLGPALGGLLGAQDPRLPFWVAAALSLAGAAYGWLVLPESLPPERRSAFAWRSASPLAAMRLLRSDRRLLGLSIAMYLYHVAHAVFPAVFVLHAGYRFGWGPGKVGLALAAFGIGSGIVQGALVKPAVARFGERTMLLVGMSCGIAGLALLAFAPGVELFWLGMLAICLWGFIGPSAQGLMTRLVAGDQQGRLQGAGASLMGVASLIGPGLFTGAFALGIAPAWGAPLPGAPYLVAALCLVAALLVAVYATAARAHGGAVPPPV
ncbi:MAG: MFS transporter [Hyphomicrobiaceae bacterium]|nr:MFS transporter [Hyphomicrobiaceae bacterium]